MKFPYIIKRNLTNEELKMWSLVYNDPSSDWDRTSEEGIWRRTQDAEKNDSQHSPLGIDNRKRMLHYKYKYDVIFDNDSGLRHLCLKDFYIWIYYTLPIENNLFEEKVFLDHIEQVGWKLINKNKNNYLYTNEDISLHIEKKRSKYTGNNDYEFYFFSTGFVRNKEIKDKPWNILKTGIRNKGQRNLDYNVFDNSFLRDLLPAQVELGCGPSVENGIPPLHFLHEVYSVTKDFRTKEFILDPKDDNILSKMLFNYDEYIPLLIKMFLSAFETKPGNFYEVLKKMYDGGHFVGEVINNNFDLMPSKVGLKEKFIRRFEESHISPKFNFHPKAKSLFVFGLHADRRKTQEAARKKGLKIVFVDTEGFSINGKFYSYPLENIERDDYLYKEKAGKAINNMYNWLNK